MTTSLTQTNHAPKGTRRLKLRKAVLKATLIIAVLTPLIFIIAALGVKFGLWGVGFGFGKLTLKLGPLMLVLAGVFGLISLILAAAIKPRKGFFAAGLALIIAFAGFGKVIELKKTVDSLPYIHDVTTDTQDVPVFTSSIMTQRAAVKGVNKADYSGKRDTRDDKLVSALQTQAYPDIRSLILSDGPSEAFGKAEAIASGLGWDIVSSDIEAGVIEATDTTFWYGFKDDIIIRLRPLEGRGTLIDVRSLSRLGESDLGKNAKRIRGFLKKLKAA